MKMLVGGGGGLKFFSVWARRVFEKSVKSRGRA